MRISDWSSDVCSSGLRHGDDPALLAQPLDDRALLVGKDIGLDVVDAEAPRDRLGGDAIVPSEHDDFDSSFAQRRKRLARRLLDRLGDGDETGTLTVDRNIARRSAIRATENGRA